MITIETKIKQAVQTNKLNPQILGERKWYNYYIQVNKLIWNRNFWDGYQIHIYSDKYKTEHLATVTI